MRTEADFEVRLTDRVRTWESKHATEAYELRETARKQLGMPTMPPEEGGIRRLILERAYRELVRAKMGWPTATQWIRGEI